ncbi:MAG: cytochrome c oxidase subunit I [Pseudomonadales bacterium]
MRPGSNGGPVARHRALQRIWSNPTGIARLTVVNHSVIGKRFLVTGMVFFVLGGVLAMLMRAQLATSDSAFLSHDAYNQVFTMHGTVMMFLFAIPVIEGLSLYLLPKLLGARDLAFPRLSSFGYFCFLFGGLILVGSLIVGVAPHSGWFMYTPLSSQPFSPGKNSDVWLLGVTFVEISAVAIGVEICATVLKIRAAGMSLNKMPLFGWYMLVTAAMIVFGFPPLILASILLEIERAFDWPFFAVARGGDPLLWQHLFWLFGHPEVYIIFLPGAALVSTMLPALARRPIIGYTAIVVSVIATGFISFALWVHHMYTVGIPQLALAFFSAASMLVAIPTAVQFFAWIATLWAGRPVMRLPMLYLFGFLALFVFGGLTGVMVALVPFDWQVHDTHFVVAHMHYVLVGGFVFPLLAGIYFWLPQVSGRMPSERLGHWAFWLIFVGFTATFFIMHFTGLLGMTRRVYTYHPEFGLDLFNLISSIGGFVMTIGFALVLLDLVLHYRFGEPAPRNPWGAETLDWAMLTPPPLYNFASLPEVESRNPLWDQPELPGAMAGGRQFLAQARHGWQETLAVDAVTGEPDYIVILPQPSWLPFASSVALAVFFLGFLFEAYWVAGAGAVTAVALFFRWGWANGIRSDAPKFAAGRGIELHRHDMASGAPGWWGLVFTHAANATLLASLIFGYFFLWTVAAAWPPPAFLDVAVWLPLTVLAALIIGMLGAHRALAAMRATGPNPGSTMWLLVAAAAGIAASVASFAVPLLGLGSPRDHAYNATVTALAGYAGLHTAIAALWSLYAWLRIKAGFVSQARSLDLQLLRLWWDYTAVAGALILICLFVAPWALAP